MPKLPALSPWSRVVLTSMSLLGLCVVPVGADDGTPGYTMSLFDGKSLFGWTVENDCEATVEDGVLVLKSGNGWLRTDHTYADFKLHVEWKALQAEKYDAGIYIRTERGGKPFPKNSFQINLLEGMEGNIGKLPGAESTGLIRPAGEWNEFDITVVGEQVTLVINGKPAYSVGGLTVPAGYIGLQVEAPKGGQFHIRNVQVTELGAVSLFNGVDLAGWEGVGKPAETCWKAEDGLLQCTGSPGPWLRSANEYGDFNLRLEYELAPDGNSGIYVRVPMDGKHHRDNDSQPPAGFEVQILDDAAERYKNLEDYQYSASIYGIGAANPRVSRPAGEWNTLEINCRGQHVTTMHNGVVVVDAPVEKYPLLGLRSLSGFLGIQNHSSVVKYRNMRIGPPLPQLPLPPSASE